MNDPIRNDGATGLRMPVKGKCRVTTARDPLTGETTATWEFVPPDCDYVEIRRDMLDHLLRTHNWGG